ncbi:hypothetical protein [Nocardia sp. NPDC005745]|uniref:hypothetical protein n=1 Tax=Nocardia sp. NPDC005745 TaxID=3157061 RepID=UPI0034080F81
MEDLVIDPELVHRAQPCCGFGVEAGPETEHGPPRMEGLGLAPFAHGPLQAPAGQSQDRWSEFLAGLGEGVRRGTGGRWERDLMRESLAFEVFEAGGE